jgi:DNA-binding CsgD family transcriptional regulator
MSRSVRALQPAQIDAKGSIEGRMASIEQEAQATKSSRSVLSPREKECLEWVAQGKTSFEIGIILNVSENTVNFHVKNAMKKMHSRTRMVAVIQALRDGYILAAEISATRR